MADAGMLKQINLQKIRNAFLAGEPFSKTELAEKTGLSFPTVGRRNGWDPAAADCRNPEFFGRTMQPDLPIQC